MTTMNELTTKHYMKKEEASESLFGQMERWADYLSLDSAGRTMQTYLKNVRLFAEWLEAEGISHPTRETIVRYRDMLMKEHKPSTVQGYIMSLKQFFKWAEAEGLYPNIARDVKGARLDTEFKHDYLTSAQEKSLLSAIDTGSLQGKRDYAMIALMLTTALRTVSVMEANIEDIRPLGDCMVLFYKGKGHSEKSKYVKLAEPVLNAINSFLAERGEKDRRKPLFCSLANRNFGERMTTKSVSRVCKTRLRNINLDSERLTAHSLRHTACTQNILNGGTLEETRQLADHRSIETTMIYVHAIDRAGNNSEIRLADALFS